MTYFNANLIWRFCKWHNKCRNTKSISSLVGSIPSLFGKNVYVSHVLYTSEATNSNKPSSSWKDSKTLNYFALLDIPEKFNIDKQQLYKNFQSKMRENHPDKYSTPSHTKQQYNDAVFISSQLNRAKQVLESPLWRAQHLVMIRKHQQSSSERQSHDEDILTEETKITDQNFLFEIMDTRLQVEDYGSKNDVAKLDQLLQENSQRMEHIISLIQKEFDQTKPHLFTIKELLAKLTYFDRIEAEIKEQLPAR
ncbi:hypothetical protein RFI_07855 [Reticulomyxa filosa]|uniref:Co-chaperone HscB C-terminal oligomerisation domain-containing protein n=1 Tax=Reticulomyxa filosa TaxID=46433 RepID=X6NVG2_RETFI|nr:hypothetical protein RFI_07855 [Reticulomyxa filosa]|eukprot:ETO29272.1 hypothetical protein RFI_07855 [Reticulomyxa filosa]